MNEKSRLVLLIATAVTVASSLGTLVPADGFIAPGCCLSANNTCSDGHTACNNGTFFPGQVCSDDNSSCRDPLVGCCDNPSSPMEGCSDNRTELQCPSFARFVAGGFCQAPEDPARISGIGAAGACVTATATATATATLTATATETPIPDGGSCVDPDDCLSGNCVDDVCCDTACDGEMEACNLEGQVGSCTAIAAGAPAASDRTLFVAVLGLLGVALMAMIRRRTA